MQNELESLQAHESQLVSAASKLEDELVSLREETGGLQEQLEAQSMVLKKTQTHNHTLERKNKVCMGSSTIIPVSLIQLAS